MFIISSSDLLDLLELPDRGGMPPPFTEESESDSSVCK